MRGDVCTRGRAIVMLLGAMVIAPAASVAQTSASTFKVAFYNIQSGKGEPGLAGRTIEFTDTTNCTDPSQPLNAWGTGIVQAHLQTSIASDPSIVALGLAESWASVCGSPENVRKALGWKSRTSERNGVAMVAKYGFSGSEEWVQLDTSLNTNPADTMWVLRQRVCLDATCSETINVFVAHWYGTGTYKNTTYDRQGRQTAEFLARAGGTEPHVLIGDLNTWDGTATVCRQNPNNAGLQPLRDAGYVDAWPLIHGAAEGYTGMLNRAGCGVPEGYAWKRPDYTWSPASFLPRSINRFGVVAAGDPAPSDHYGLITEFPRPGAGAAPADTTPPAVAFIDPADGITVTGGPIPVSLQASDDTGVTRVEILEDGVVTHTLTAEPYALSCRTIASTSGTHTLGARAYDAAGNVSLAQPRQIQVQPLVTDPPADTGSDIVLYARNATTVSGNWQIVSDAEAAGGARMWNRDQGLPKLTTAQAAPADYFELTFDAEAGRGYRVWLRGRADRDYWGNDSAYLQFDGSVTQAGSPVFRIGTSSATWLGVEDCSGCAIRAWGWNDNAYGSNGTGALIYFAASGPQTLRVQRREDGMSIDQIVLSPERYLLLAPGAGTNDVTILPATGTTAPPPPSAAEIVLTARDVSAISGAWQVTGDESAAGSSAVRHPDAGAAKLSAALASPTDYVELTFHAEAGRAYRLWMRGRADRDHWANDSVFVQFSGSTTAGGSPVARIGSTDAFVVNLEDGVNAGIAGWGWQDNGYGIGVLGPVVSFETTGMQTIRIQTREDGYRFDQVVLSSEQYLTSAPGALKNDGTVLR